MIPPKSRKPPPGKEFGHPLHWIVMTLEELEREYVSLRQQADAVRSYL
jgi:hypothetical protein